MSAPAHPFHSPATHGFVRVATSTPRLRTADVAFNAAGILEEARRAHDAGVDLLLYPELCLSSYALDDLLLQSALLEAVEQELAGIVAASAELAPVLVIGAPLLRAGRLYNCAVVIAGGEVLGAVGVEPPPPPPPPPPAAAARRAAARVPETSRDCMRDLKWRS